MSNHNYVDMTGKVVGRLTALRMLPRTGPKTYWECVCECGTVLPVRQDGLSRETTKSCGCLQLEYAYSNKAHLTHGLGPAGLQSSYDHMITRCYDARHKKYSYYGGRGITVCERWRNDPRTFLEDMGPKPSPKHTLDRIDVNGNYEPGNCRWATRAEQSRNTRRTKLNPTIIRAAHYAVTQGGLSVAEVVRIFGVNRNTLESAIKGEHWKGVLNEGIYAPDYADTLDKRIKSEQELIAA